jgi:signal peptidase I
LVDKQDKISAQRLSDSGPRKPWLAFVFAFLFPGLGQLYNGQLAAALAILVAITISHLLIAVPNQSLPFWSIGFNYAVYILAIALAVLYAVRYKSGFTVRKYNNWIIYMVFLMFGLVATGLPNQMLYSFHQVEFDCMGEHYPPQTVVYVSNLDYLLDQPEEEDLVLFKHPHNPNQQSLARIWARGPKKIQVRDNSIYLNGYQVVTEGVTEVDVPTLGEDGSEMVSRDSLETVDMPEGYYLLIGDNSYGWADQTCCAVVPRSLIEGKLEYVYLDADKFAVEDSSAFKKSFFYLFLQ